MAAGASTDSFVKAGYWIFDSIRPVSEIPIRLFTHLYAGFVKVNNDGHLIIPEPYLQQFRDFTAKTVEVRNSNVKFLLSIGGEGADLSAMVASSDKRRNLITDSIRLARNFGFDGLDLCWMYPSNADQEDQLRDLLIEWRHALDKDSKGKSRAYKLLLTAAVFHHPVVPGADGMHKAFSYPIQAISDNLDWINVLAIDFYTPSNSSGETGPVHAWNTRDTDRHHEPTRCGSRGIRDWIDNNNNGVPAQKLVLGLPFYGYEWNLINSNVYEYFAPANPGGYKDYRTIKKIVHNYQTWYDTDYVATYSHNNDGSWIGYDDKKSISEKVRQAKSHGLRGYVAWHLEGDDDNWTLSHAAFDAADAVNP